jgi:ABC-type phosphate transport system permease subunit
MNAALEFDDVSALANEFAEADPGLHTSALMELGLILMYLHRVGAQGLAVRMVWAACRQQNVSANGTNE